MSAMKKDVIYVDVEDDITAIISKVRASEAKIVALVPPKRLGVLQSAVNVKLLKKSAGEAEKQLVLITSDRSLLSLAAGVKLPVAKNLQSRPEVVEMEALSTDAADEVIDGAELPIGELANIASSTPESPQVVETPSKRIDLSDLNQSSSPVGGRSPETNPPVRPRSQSPATRDSAGKKIKVPNFLHFRRQLFWVGGGIVILIVFLWWATQIAPQATVTIAARTSAVPIDRTLVLTPNSASQTDQLQLKPTMQQIKKTVSADFTATGTKAVGNKATGTITITNSQTSDDITLPVGAIFTAASGQKFASTVAVTVPGAKVVGGGIQAGSVSAAVQATDIGTDYNVAPQAYSVQNYSMLSASGTQMSGGTSNTVTVVSQSDIDKAVSSLASPDPASVKGELRQKFGSDMLTIDESLTTSPGMPTPSPNAGDQAQQGKVTLETTYTMLGITRSDVGAVLTKALNDAMTNKGAQSIFNNGENTIQFQFFQKLDGGAYNVHLTTTGYIGATIDTKQLAVQLEGKRFGDINQIVNQYPGVNKVDINFSPFWVTQAPHNPNKIHINFSISSGQ